MAFFGAKPKKAAAPMATPEPTKATSPFFEEAPTKATPLFSEAPSTGRGFFGQAPTKGVPFSTGIDFASYAGSVSAQGGYSAADDTLSGYHFLRLTPGETYTISALRQEFDLDPGMWIFEGHRSFQDFLDSGELNNQFFSGSMTGYLGNSDDVISHPGPYSDPQLTITVPDSGKLTVVVTEVASGSDDGGDGRFDYQLTVEGPNAGNATSTGSSFFGQAPQRGEALVEEEERPSYVIDFSDESELLGFAINVLGTAFPVLEDESGELGGEPPFIALLSNDSASADTLMLPDALTALLDDVITEGSQFTFDIPSFAFEPGAESIVISFDWLFGSQELSEDGDATLQNDVAFYYTNDGRAELLSSVTEISPDLFSAWQTTTVTFDLNDETIDGISFSFGVLNIGDYQDTSVLAIDNITLTGISEEFVNRPPVPELV